VSTPSVSVVIPTFNRLEYLREAVASVFAQNFTDWELVIADDGSDAATRDYLATLRDSARVKLLLLDHSGNPGAVRNVAARHACGEWLAFLDSDDLWHPSKLAMQVALMHAHPHRHWGYCAIERIDGEGCLIPRPNHRWRPRPQGEILEHVIRWRAGIAMRSVIVKRQLFADVGGFDEAHAMFEDFDLWLRLAAASPASALDVPVVRVRQHTEHFGSQGECGLREWIALFDRWKPRLAEPRLRRALEAQSVECTVRIAHQQALGARRASALRTLFGTRRGAWRHAGWWKGAMRVAARCVFPVAPAREPAHPRHAAW